MNGLGPRANGTNGAGPAPGSGRTRRKGITRRAAHRPVITLRPVTATWPAPGAGSGGFAAALQARYAAGRGPWSRLALSLRQTPGAPAPVSQQSFALTRLRLTVAPRWQFLLNDQRQFTTAAGPAPGTQTQPGRPAAAIPAVRLVDRVLNRPAAPVLITRLAPHTWQRLVERQTRLAMVASPAPTLRPSSTKQMAPGTPGAAVAAPVSAAPVARVVRRNTVISAAAADGERPSRRPGDDEPSWPADRPAARPSLDAGEIDRVTQHVLRTIDRQILARRERTGRV